MEITSRYDKPKSWFRRCGKSGLHLPAISLGFWHNFGAPGTASHGLNDEAEFHDRARDIMFTAFDHGITHFDLANNYGPPPGSAEERCGKILPDFPREELVISSKAGYPMWAGPYGRGGSRKYLVQSCDQSLKRLRLDHLDIFYHHCPDSETPLEESLEALDFIVKSGRALYVGISNYPGVLAENAIRLCKENGWTRPIIHQPCYNLFNRRVEADLLPVAERENFGVIPFSPLAQGLLTNKYLDGIPTDSRAASPSGFLKAESIDQSKVSQIQALNQIAANRGQSLAQLAITWVLRHPTVTSALIGASRPSQITDLIKSIDAAPLTEAELDQIEAALAD